MRIVQFTAENIKKLKVAEIRPNGDIVTIAGRNAQGKTSVLDAIWYALGGTSNIPAQPIRRGAKSAVVKLDLGEIRVERRFTEKTSTLLVESADGSRFASPQKMLDELIGKLSFDPLAFSRMKPRDQYEELRRVAQLDVDLEELDRQNRADFEKRTDINRQAKAKRAQAEAMPVPEVILNEDIDEQAILDQITNAAEKNALIQQRAQRRATAAESVKQKIAKIAELEAEIEALQHQIGELHQSAEETQKAIDEAPPLPDPVDVTELRTKLDHARASNAARKDLQKRQEIEAEAQALEEQSEGLTLTMRSRDDAKAEAISRAAMPVPDLGFGDGVVLYQGVPLDQASSAEQLRVSLAIAMAANPKVRVIRIQDGSLLDADSLQHIADMAAEKDYQVWIERVDSSGQVGIVIEDGQVVAVNKEAA